MSRIKKIFKKNKFKKKKTLIAFITAGYPHPKLTTKILKKLVKYGVDIIEIGIPFSDPIAEGKIIQEACEKALKYNINIKNIFNYIKKFRKKNKKTPIVLMGYANPIENFGINNFIKKLKKFSIDGIIIVDYSFKESKKILKKLKKYNINYIFLLTPTSTKKRIKKIIKFSNGFIYYISVIGITGYNNNINIKEIKNKINYIKKKTSLPIAVGFGINNIKIAKKINKIADGIIIGSKIIKELKIKNKKKSFNRIKNFILNIKK